MEQLLRMAIAGEEDVFAVRQRAREVASMVGFDLQDQVRIATALSEVGREAMGDAGVVEFLLDLGLRPNLVLRVSGGAADPAGDAVSGVHAARRLVDAVTEESSGGQRVVTLRRELSRARSFPPEELRSMRAGLGTRARPSPLDELRTQNLELLRALEELTRQQEALATANEELEETNRGVMAMYGQLSEELDETNRGVVALYAELDERGIQLRQASEAKSRFLANVSHELRAPVTSILGLARLLADTSEAAVGERERQVALVGRSATELLDLVNQLLDLAKAEAGRLEPDIMSVHLQGLFADLRGSLRPVVPPSVRLDIPDVADIPAIDTDPVLLGQVLRNLLTNALKFTSDGSVTMTVSVRESRQHVEIEVTDTGVGIAAEELHAIFEEFHQIKGAHQLAQRGTGLGLPYARRLTEILGGSLVVTSEEGVGSTFTVRLPIHAMSAAEAPGASESVPMLDSVLVADDDDAFREVMRSMLQGLATRVVEARDGEAALAAATAARPDLVFVDLRMPGMDGSGVLIRMAEHPMLHDVPVVVVTSVPLHMAAVSFGPNPPRLVAKEELTPELVRSLVAAASSASAGAA